MTPEAFGRTIQLFLVDGTPTGLRKATTIAIQRGNARLIHAFLAARAA